MAFSVSKNSDGKWDLKDGRKVVSSHKLSRLAHAAKRRLEAAGKSEPKGRSASGAKVLTAKQQEAFETGAIVLTPKEWAEGRIIVEGMEKINNLSFRAVARWLDGFGSVLVGSEVGSEVRENPNWGNLYIKGPPSVLKAIKAAAPSFRFAPTDIARGRNHSLCLWWD